LYFLKLRWLVLNLVEDWFWFWFWIWKLLMGGSQSSRWCLVKRLNFGWVVPELRRWGSSFISYACQSVVSVASVNWHNDYFSVVSTHSSFA
jgi:hypothetical protein